MPFIDLGVGSTIPTFSPPSFGSGSFGGQTGGINTNFGLGSSTSSSAPLRLPDDAGNTLFGFSLPTGVAPFPSINTVNLDGGTEFLSGLAHVGGAVLGAIGSTGDEEIVTTRVSGGGGGGGGGMFDNPLIIVGGILAVGAIIWASGK